MTKQDILRSLLRLPLILTAFALFACGKDDDRSGGGGDPDTPPEETTTVWESNSLHFAKLFGSVRSVDEMFDGVNTVAFDPEGYIVSYNIKGYDAQNNPIETDFRCTYTADKRIGTITSDLLTVEFAYGDHGKYVEVEQDIFEYNQIKYLYVFQPRFLKDLVSVTLAAGSERLKFACRFDGNRMTLEDPDGNTWSETTYDGAFPRERITRFSGEEYKQTESGYAKIAYTAVATETFTFNTQNGNLLAYADKVAKTYSDTSTATEESSTEYNDDRFNTVARQGNEVFTYDSFGDYVHIESNVLISDFTYTRDEHDNWYDRTEKTLMFGETYNFRDQRTITYY